jgi:glycosyltransferase involved in cell wall biosynthesis
MKTLPKICMMTNIYFDDSLTLLYAKTILAWGYHLTAIMPGEIPESLSSYEIHHYPIPLPTHNFDFNSSFLNALGGLFQRFRNSILTLFYLLKAKPDICVCIQPDSWLISIIGKSFLHNRVIVDLREIYEDRASAFPAALQPFIRKLLRFIFRLLSRFTDEIIHVSVARQVHYSYLSKPGIVISAFPILENFPNRNSLNNNPEVSVVHAGSLRWTYASDQFVESIPIVLEQAPNVKFVVIGGITSEMKNMQLIDRLIDSGKLILIPRISHEKVIEILLKCDIGVSLVLPLDQTHILAMPRKFFEYLAAGLPVVAADVPTLREVVESSNCGVLVDPCLPKSIAEGILQLVFNQGRRTEYGANGRRMCEIDYNWHQESKKLQNLLDSLLVSSCRST